MKRGKRGKGRPPKKVEVDVLVQRAVQLATGEKGKHGQAVRTVDLQPDVNRFLEKRAGITQVEFYDRVTAKLEELVELLADDLLEKHDKITPGQLPVSFGILLDKVNNLKGRPQTLTANVNMGFGPKQRSREEILEILGGGSVNGAPESPEGNGKE